ncbi:MAG: hypothetical protein HYT38_01210, partial [Candidatus Sungbacteria bacterium]|nr:hypothetical protein [Candidatus Sungbacteria bacterium]
MRQRPEIARHLSQNGNYRSALDKAVEESFQRYGNYLQRPVGKTTEKGFDLLGLIGDVYFFMNPIGGLGVKFISTSGKTAADLPALLGYAVKTGDYLSIP